MKRVTVILSALVAVAAIAFIFLGLNMRHQGMSYTVYTEPDAVNKVLNQIQDFSHTEQAAAWHAGLEQYETPHKHLVDTGESWIALGVGLIAALCIWLVLNKGLKIIGFMSVWMGVCVLQIPLIVRYYTMRQERFDYHPSTDTVLIPIINESFLVLVGLTLSMVIIYFTMRKHELSSCLPLKQVSPTRLMLMGLWIVLLILSVALSFQDAKLGPILSCITLIPMVYRMMVAAPK